METITEIIVKEEDIDVLDHVNNGVYITYLEDARSDWLKRAECSYEDMSQEGLSTVVLKLNILYKKEARLGEILRVKTIPTKLGTKSFTFDQFILNEKDEVILEAEVVNVMFDVNKRKGTKVAEKIAKHFPNK